jgi:hypothetical protein
MCGFCGTGYPWPIHFLFYDWWGLPYHLFQSEDANHWYLSKWYLFITWIFATSALLLLVIFFTYWLMGVEIGFTNWINVKLWGGAFS